MIFNLCFRNCPQTLVAPLVKISLDQTHQTLRKTPEQYGYLAKTNGKTSERAFMLFEWNMIRAWLKIRTIQY